MKIKTTELKKALETVKPGLANKEMIEQTTSFAFKGRKVVTYNDSISISYPLEEMEEIEGAIKAEELYQLLNKITKEEIDLELKESSIELKTGKTKINLNLQKEVKLPVVEELERTDKWYDLPSNFIDALRFSTPICSKDMSRIALNSVHICKEGYMEATDNFRIIRFQLEEGMPTEDFFLPAASALEVTKLKPEKISLSEGWVHFQTEEKAVISCRIPTDERYPTKESMDSMLNVEGEELSFPKAIVKSLDLAGIFSKRDYFLEEAVEITFDRRRVKIHAESDTGSIQDVLNIKYDGSPLSFSVTPYLLKDMLKETLDFKISKNRLKFEMNKWEYVAMLRG